MCVKDTDYLDSIACPEVDHEMFSAWVNAYWWRKF